ncbi:hypothetical protein PMZ80_011087 [Knufia obscura]|uniref:DUF7029 domain-containing protein n=1 Tax=Knufia obscura TaxID=1635080 RepID=A0ABR0R7W9_9EURO|nr:hypothetical protein PMZ80_011087 [Knufia obscura]
MSILAYSALALSTFSLVQGSTAYSSAYGSAPSVIEIWEPDVTVTEHFTTTVRKTCPDCQTAIGNAFYDVSPSQTKSSVTPLWSQPSGPSPTTTLVPIPHWHQVASDPQVLVPDQKVQMYYAPQGAGDSQTTHQFQWINTTLSAPSVPLDQSSLLNYAWSADTNTLSVTFSSKEAFDTARSKWAISNFLVAYAEGCGDYQKGDNCYIQIQSMSFSSSTYSCQVSGKALTLKQCLVSMDASWGKYSPVGNSSQPAYKGDFSAAAMSVWSSVFSKYVSSSSSGSGPRPTGWAYTPAGAAAGGRGNGGAGSWSNWAYGSNVVTSSASITSATPTSGSPGSGHQGNGDGFNGSGSDSSSNGPGSNPSEGSNNGSSSHGSSSFRTTTASPQDTVTTTGPIQTSTTTISGSQSYDNGTGQYPYGNGTSTGLPYGATGTSATITTPPMTSTTTDALSSVVSSLSSIFSSMAASNNSTGSFNGTAPISNSTSGFFNGTAPSSDSTSGFNTTLPLVNSTIPSSNSTSGLNATLPLNSTIPSNSTTGLNNTSPFAASNCTRGTDPIFGLPTTCIGPAFDLDLDSIDGFLTLNRTEFAAIVALFPDLITRSVLSNTKRGIELSKRCDWYDVACFAEEAWDGATSVIESVGSVIVSEATSAASAIEAAATELAKDIVEAAEAVGQEISEASAAVIAELEKGLSELLSFDTSTSIPVNVRPGSDALQESPWGDQVLLGSFGKELGGDKKESKSEGDTKSEPEGSTESKTEASFGLNVYCVDCAITGTVELEGALTVGPSGISKLMVGSKANLDFGLGVGIEIEAEVSHTFGLTIFQQGIPEFCSGSTLCIGPYVKLAAELTFKAEANGYLMAGGHWTITDATAQLWAYGGTTNANNWTPVFTPKYNAGGELKLSVEYGMPLSIGCGITILDGTFAKNAELSITPSIEASATAAINVTSDGTEAGTEVDTTTQDGECDGIGLSLDWNVKLGYNLLDLMEGDLWELGEQNIAEACVAWDSFKANGTSSANPDSTIGFGSGSGNITSAYSNISLIDTADSSPLLICGNGNVYKVDAGYIGTDNASGCTTSWLAYSGLSANATTATSNSSSVVADISRRLPVIYPDVLSKTGVSRFRLVNAQTIPAKSEYVAFDYYATTGWLGVDRKGKKYQAIQCKNLNATTAGIGAGMNEVFMVSSSAASKGLGVLGADQVVYSVSNGYVRECKAMTLAIASVTPAVAPVMAKAAEDAIDAVNSVISGIAAAATALGIAR